MENCIQLEELGDFDNDIEDEIIMPEAGNIRSRKEPRKCSLQCAFPWRRKHNTAGYKKLSQEDKFLCKCSLCWFIIAILFLMLWMSDLYIGEGVMRWKYEGEACGLSVIVDRKCLPGLHCIDHKCFDRKLEIAKSQFDAANCPPPRTCIYSNNQPQIPQKPITRVYYNVIKYHDYEEYPDRYFTPEGSTADDNVLSYSHCKNSCSSKSSCKAACFNSKTGKCQRMTKFSSPGSHNSNWICAEKLE